MSDQENQNQNEEEYEEENMMNQNDLEHQEQEDEEGQDIYAFDIQINDDLYLLVIGKTEENKILLRLLEKEEQSHGKPFFQNEFSLEDLRIINPIFNDIDDENIAFQYLVSSLNNSDKEIKIIDEAKIKFIIYINDDEDGKTQFDFVLFKTIDEEDNENENEGEEENMEEGVEIINDEINNNEEQEINNVEINEEKVAQEENIPAQVQIEQNQQKKTLESDKNRNSKKLKNNAKPLEISNQNLNINANTSENKEQIGNGNDANNNNNMLKEELLNIINNINENFENKILIQNETFNRMKEEIIKESNEKIKTMNDALNKKDTEINKLNNTINNLQQKLNEYENKINDMNIKFTKLEKLNSSVNNNENRYLRNSGRKTEQENEKKFNELKENIKNNETGINEIKKDYENDKINNENKIQILNKKIIDLESKLNINLNKNANAKNNVEKNQRIFDLENNIKNLENKINEYELDQVLENIAILTEKQNDTQIYEIINNLEANLNELKEKIAKQETEINRNSLTKAKNNMDPEIMNKINKHEELISTIQLNLNQIQEEQNNEMNNKIELEKKLDELIKVTNNLNSKTDTLFKTTKKLENNNNELNNKTNNIIMDVSNLSELYNNSAKIAQNSKYIKTNYNRTQIQNMEYISDNTNQKNKLMYYNKTTPNIHNKNRNISINTINSNIVNFEDIIFLLNRIKDINSRISDINITLVYRATEDGDRSMNFHKKCDKIGPNIVLIKTQKGNIFGGFTFKNWEHLPRDIDENKPNLGSASRDPKAFGFNVNKQKIYNNERPREYAIWCNRNYGPTFKNNLFQIFDSCLTKGGYCNVRSNSHFGGQMFDYEIAGGEGRFRVEELEVFEVKLG